MSGSDWENNPYERVPVSEGSQFRNLICYTIDATGARVLVMRLNGATKTGWNVFLKQGSGYLYESGNLAMKAGILTWTNLDASTSDSMDSDSAVPVSDDSSDGGDSADA